LLQLKSCFTNKKTVQITVLEGNKMNNNQELENLRHSAAHLLAQAVLELYPKTILTIGPVTKNGFFYDFLPKTNFKEEDLPKIEERMREIVKRNQPITQKEVRKEEAIKLFKDNPFKLELIAGIPDETVGISQQGDFFDLCRGGHVESTGKIKAFKLTGLSGAYWRADKENAALQRISGTAFKSEKDLLAYEQRIEDAKLYDHRRLGKQLDLFSFHEEGPGLPFFLPKGFIVYNELINYMRELLKKYDYQEISTPTILNEDLWKQSGHYYNYKENMYFTEPIEEKTFALKPMNCPGAILIYKERPRSYRELPVKLSEFGKVHRHELSGTLNGLFRVRAFTQDDAHIFCTKEQLEDQILELIQIIKTVIDKFGFDKIQVGLSTRPKKSMGTDEMWERGENALKHALETAKIEYTIFPGDGAFYGPKIDFLFVDSLDREWQCGTIQIDFNNPENFDINYINSEGKKERPIMIHRVIYGSLERFFGVLLEHYKGLLPFWLAPIQMRILTITDEQQAYGQKVLDLLKNLNIRAELEKTSNTISAKIKTAQLEKIPVMIVIGQKEQDQNTVTFRYNKGEQEFGIKLEDLPKKINELFKK